MAVVKPETWYRWYWVGMGLGFTLLNGYITAHAVRWGVREGLWDFYIQYIQLAAQAATKIG